MGEGHFKKKVRMSQVLGLVIVTNQSRMHDIPVTNRLNLVGHKTFNPDLWRSHVLDRQAFPFSQPFFVEIFRRFQQTRMLP